MCTFKNTWITLRSQQRMFARIQNSSEDAGLYSDRRFLLDHVLVLVNMVWAVTALSGTF